MENEAFDGEDMMESARQQRILGAQKRLVYMRKFLVER
jgi:hypothetical protein